MGFSSISFNAPSIVYVTMIPVLYLYVRAVLSEPLYTGSGTDWNPEMTAATLYLLLCGSVNTTGPPENPGLLFPSRRNMAPSNRDTVALLTKGKGKPSGPNAHRPNKPYGKPRK